MSNLLTQTELARHFGIDPPTLQKYIKKLKIEPKYQRKNGRGVLTLYDEHDAIAALSAVLTKPAEVPQTVEAKAELDVAEITIPLMHIRETVGAIEAEVERLRQDVEPALQRLMKQNEVLFHTLEKLVAQGNSKTSSAPPASTPAPAPELAPPPALKTSPPAPETPKLKRVAIVGLHPNQVPHIKKEFGEVFDLRFINVDDAKGSAFKNALGYCDHVFTIVNFINHSVEEAVKASGAQYSRVVGGMSTLRTALTDLWVRFAEADKKASSA